jgi:membrane protein DedA with SNARE-associated domain
MTCLNHILNTLVEYQEAFLTYAIIPLEYHLCQAFFAPRGACVYRLHAQSFKKGACIDHQPLQSNPTIMFCRNVVYTVRKTNGYIIMNSLDLFLIQYGLAAIFIILLVKTIGVPIPIPADLIILTVAAQSAQGKLIAWQTLIAILIALVLGGLIQFVLARGPGRGLLYRFGRYIGLTSPRLDAASARVKKGGALGISIAILVPGVRGAAIAASGLADMPLRTFLPGLVAGSALFLGLHFSLGFLGGSLFTIIGHVLPLSWITLLALAFLVIVFALWVVAYRRKKAARHEVGGEALELWHEGICPACLALYAANQLQAAPGGLTKYKDRLQTK